MAKPKATPKRSAKSKSAKPSKKTATDPSQSLDDAPRLGERVLNVLPDMPDLRDRIYEPALLDLAITMDPPDPLISPVRDQGDEGACTGFALATAITLMNTLRHQRLVSDKAVPMMSPRMLYEMAKIHDEWPGEEYEGSSIRGALKGFFHNGVCRDDLAPYKSGEKGWSLTVDQAKDARNVGLGAYYRLRPEIIDYHAALNEAGVIYVSATIHSSWQAPKNGEIVPSKRKEGGHAFVIVGYSARGFLIQNSWGPKWGGYGGRPGIALWRYEDWAENVMDAWVLRLSVPTPDAFDLTFPKPTAAPAALFDSPSVAAPRREEIIGHVIHLDDGKLVERGRYATPLSVIQETADFLADEEATAKRGYAQLMFYAHGGLNDVAASANRINKMKEVFKRNGIYPIHFMWETGFFETLGDVLRNASSRTEAQVGSPIADISDRILERLAGGPGRAIWRDMKGDAERSFAAASGGKAAVGVILKGNAKRSKPLGIHCVGHSAGSIFLANMLGAMGTMNPLKDPVQTCSLMAPACTIDLFNADFAPNIGKADAATGVRKLIQYSLIDQRELDDSVGPYRKSLLYFVSRAFEDAKNMPLLGMQIHSDSLTLKAGHKIRFAGRAPVVTDSKTHGGFDNDRATMNDILKSILGKKPTPAKAFSQEDLEGF